MTENITKPATTAETASPCPAPMPPIRCRDDLSFTHREGAGEGLANWSVTHDPAAKWGDGVMNGRRLFAEVETLAAADELEAFHAILFALNSGTWRGSAGTEYGFSEALAALAIQGKRSLLAGADRFDFEAECRRRCEEEDQASRQGEESSAGQAIAEAKAGAVTDGLDDYQRGGLAFKSLLQGLAVQQRLNLAASGDINPAAFVPLLRAGFSQPMGKEMDAGFWDAFGIFLELWMDGTDLDIDRWNVLADLAGDSEEGDRHE